MAFDDIAPIYDETRTVPDWVLTEFYQRTLKSDIQSNPGLVVLDAGVGTGRTVGPLLDLGINLVGVDISKKMLQRMKEKFSGRVWLAQINLLVADVTQLPFRDRAFDVVITVHLLHLLKNWRQAILETKRVLKPENAFVVASHNQPELETKFGRMYLEILLNKAHERSRRERILRRVLKIVGSNRMKPVKRVLERVSFQDSWDSYLKKHSRSREAHAIRWKEEIGIPTVADRLQKRFFSVQTAMSPKEYEKLMFKLNKWRDDRMKRNPFLEIMREFAYVKVQF